MDDHTIINTTLGGLGAALSGLLFWIMRVNSKRIDSLEERVRKTENECVGEDKVRALIEDVCNPIKESNEEIRKDVKEILHVIINNNYPPRV